MTPTIYAGILTALLLLALIPGNRLAWVWRLFCFSQVFGATSAASLTMLGESTFAVTHYGVAIFAAAVLFFVAPSQPEATRKSVSAHIMALLLLCYTLIISFFGPRLFSGDINLIGLRPDMLDGVAVATPLKPRSSNITASVYMAGSFTIAIAVSILFYRKLPKSEFRTGLLLLTATHFLFGVVDSIGAQIGQEGLLDFLRTANYEMLEQHVGTVKRLSGVMTEPSAFAGIGVPLAVFATEDWLRSKQRLSGVIGLTGWALILASTSTTGYFGLAIYGTALLARLLFASSFRHMLVALVLIFSSVVVFFGWMFFSPASFASSMDFLSELTLKKADSNSAIERTQWAMQGWQAFQTTWGLGAGAGSFRSSSFALAIIGSVGVFGAIFMSIYLIQIGRQFFVARADKDGLPRTAAWAAIFGIAPAFVSGASPDPGFLFGVFAGMALCPVDQAVRQMTSPRGGRRRFASHIPSEGMAVWFGGGTGYLGDRIGAEERKL